MGRKEGTAVPLWRGELGLCLHNVAWADVYFRTNWHLHSSSRLTTIDMGRKLVVVPLLGGELGSHLTQSHLGGGLPPYQVAS